MESKSFFSVVQVNINIIIHVVYTFTIHIYIYICIPLLNPMDDVGVDGEDPTNKLLACPGIKFSSSLDLG